jgi:putative membrane protein
MKEEKNQPIANPSDNLANERTFLAWIRTSIAIMGFGFVVVKFSLFVRQIALVLKSNLDILPEKGYSAPIGILLVAVGAFMAMYSYLSYRNTEKQLLNQAYKPSVLPALILTIGIVTVGTLLVIYLIPGL